MCNYFTFEAAALSEQPCEQTVIWPFHSFCTSLLSTDALFQPHTQAESKCPNFHTLQTRFVAHNREVWTAERCPKPHFIKLKREAISALSAESTAGADFTRLCLEELTVTWRSRCDDNKWSESLISLDSEHKCALCFWRLLIMYVSLFMCQSMISRDKNKLPC